MIDELGKGMAPLDYLDFLYEIHSTVSAYISCVQEEQGMVD